MAASMTQASRKRTRDTKEESSEFMPLSKRINNLHINSLNGMQEKTVEKMDSTWSNDNFTPSPSHSEPSATSSVCDGGGSSQSSYTNEYRPELDRIDNPFYYESNKLLYSLYLERIQRSLELY